MTAICPRGGHLVGYSLPRLPIGRGLQLDHLGVLKMNRSYQVKIDPHDPPSSDVRAIESSIDLLDFAIRETTGTFSTPAALAQAMIAEVNEIYGTEFVITQTQPACPAC